MSQVSHSLANALKELDMTQVRFAELCQIDPGQMNRYVRGSLDIGAANLATIARHLPEPHRGRAVAAWLRDHIPDSAADSVSVSAQGDLFIREMPDRVRTQLKEEVQLAVDYLADKSIDHTEIADLLVDLHRALRGQSPNA